MKTGDKKENTNQELLDRIQSIESSVNVIHQNKQWHETRAQAQAEILEKVLLKMIDALGDKLVDVFR